MTSVNHDATASAELRRLYEAAFADHGSRALWNLRPSENPTVAEVRVVARALRVEGDLASRILAEQMEQLARAAD